MVDEGGSVRFRRAGPADVAAVVDLVESAYRGKGSRVGWTTEADLLDGQRTEVDDVRATLDDPHALFLLAEVRGALAGCCRLSGTPGTPAHLGMFAVRPDLQGHSVGTVLLSEAERVARSEWAATGVRMEVIAQRVELIAWYARRGYHPTGETLPFPYGDPRFGIPRRDDLVFVVLEKHFEE